MWNFALGLFQQAGFRRRQAKARLTLMMLHFAALIAVLTAIQFYNQKLFDPYVTLTGLGMICGFALLIWVRGGITLDTLIGVYVATNNKRVKRVHALARILIGFFTVEMFVNNCFAVLPFYGSLGGFLLVISATGCYFMFRHMAGQEISWASWVWVQKLNLGVGLLVCIVSVLRDQSKAPQNLNFKHLMMAGVLTGLALMVYGLFFAPKGTQAPTTASAPKGDHHA